ncbi:DUF4190 domain-containing protein [Streptomyces lancefieldiae]|uniref:DUF4190 domain-containing protein n=1 Tax=Streptomyces lancefieldiae TaxID=3075520 RepID=A0ABU3AJ11_9ACTN|nr:DUF4190 domain-containing protein [Streptomyces sp. DSM 40712]MDT0609542.1 DUF4190 domain-containing protein [Streptomyces sp. DSM 40712]
MTDAPRPGGDSAGGYDPWAPPESGPSPDKGREAGAWLPRQPGRPPVDGGPPVHDQPTVTSMPAAGFPAPDAAVPPPPIAPGGPGVQGGYGYPGYPQGYGWSGIAMPPQNGMGTAAMVLGILACCLFCLYGVVSVVLGILAVVFGVKGRRKAERGEAANHGQAQAGFVMGIIGIVLGIAVIVLLAIGIVAAINDESDYDDPYYGAPRPAPVSVAVQS